MSVSTQDPVSSDGFSILPAILNSPTLDALRAAVDLLLSDHAERSGVRHVRRDPLVRSNAIGPMRDLVLPYLGQASFAVRALVFDKTPTANWKVAWHQDVTIAVLDYRECPGWGPWSRKAGIWHVRPPVEVLENMLTVRLHLDECGSTKGPVRVIPGSHRAGRLSDSQIEAISRSGTPTDCLLELGGVLLMRPLILHASAPATTPAHRRVLHVEYAATSLPDGFEWSEKWGIQSGAV